MNIIIYTGTISILGLFMMNIYIKIKWRLTFLTPKKDLDLKEKRMTPSCSVGWFTRKSSPAWKVIRRSCRVTWVQPGMNRTEYGNSILLCWICLPWHHTVEVPFGRWHESTQTFVCYRVYMYRKRIWSRTQSNPAIFFSIKTIPNHHQETMDNVGGNHYIYDLI